MSVGCLLLIVIPSLYSRSSFSPINQFLFVFICRARTVYIRYTVLCFDRSARSVISDLRVLTWPVCAVCSLGNKASTAVSSESATARTAQDSKTRPETTTTTTTATATTTPIVKRVRVEELTPPLTTALTHHIPIPPLVQLIAEYAVPFIGVLKRIAGSGEYGCVDGSGSGVSFRRPYGMTFAVDRKDDSQSGDEAILIADNEMNVIRRLHISSGRVERVVGSGDVSSVDGPSFLSCSLIYPNCICADHRVRGRYFIGELYAVRVCDPAGRVWTLAGSGTSGDGGLSRVTSIVQDASGGRLYVCDSNNDRIRLIDIESKALTTAAAGGGGDAEMSGALRRPGQMVWSRVPADGDRRVIYLTAMTHIRRFDTASGE